MREIDDFNKSVDRQFKTIKWLAYIWAAVCMLLVIGGTLFSGWVIVMLMKHFGVI